MYFACCSAQTAHTLVLTGLEKCTTDAKAYCFNIYTVIHAVLSLSSISKSKIFFLIILLQFNIVVIIFYYSHSLFDRELRSDLII